MLAINMDDVINVLNSCKPYLIALGIALALAIIVTVACMKLKKPVKKLVRKEAWIAFLMAAVVIINLICFIPMSSMISLAMGNGTITEETSNEATALCEDIADEGIVLLKNDATKKNTVLLPIASDSYKRILVVGDNATRNLMQGGGSSELKPKKNITPLDGLKKKFGDRLWKYCLEQASSYLENGKLELHNDRLKLTREGIFISDGIMSDLLEIE